MHDFSRSTILVENLKKNTVRMNTTHILAANLRLLMDQRGWSQAALAGHCGVSQRTISNVLRGEVSITLDTLDKIAAAFGLSGHWLCIPALDWSKAA